MFGMYMLYTLGHHECNAWHAHCRLLEMIALDRMAALRFCLLRLSRNVSRPTQSLVTVWHTGEMNSVHILLDHASYSALHGGDVSCMKCTYRKLMAAQLECDVISHQMFPWMGMELLMRTSGLWWQWCWRLTVTNRQLYLVIVRNKLD